MKIALSRGGTAAMPPPAKLALLATLSHCEGFIVRRDSLLRARDDPSLRRLKSSNFLLLMLFKQPLSVDAFLRPCLAPHACSKRVMLTNVDDSWFLLPSVRFTQTSQGIVAVFSSSAEQPLWFVVLKAEVPRAAGDHRGCDPGRGPAGHHRGEEEHRQDG